MISDKLLIDKWNRAKNVAFIFRVVLQFYLIDTKTYNISMFIYKFFEIRDTKRLCGNESRLSDEGFHQIWRHRSNCITERIFWIAHILRNGDKRSFHLTKYWLILAFLWLGPKINELLHMEYTNAFPIKITFGLH